MTFPKTPLHPCSCFTDPDITTFCILYQADS
jgi:hypothetical protein